MNDWNTALGSSLPLSVSRGLVASYCPGYAGQPGSNLEAHWNLFSLLSTLIQEPELEESAQLALASGPADNPYGQQLAARLLPVVRGLADSMQLQPPTTDAGHQDAAASSAREKLEWLLVICLKRTASMFGYIQPQAQAAMAAGPAWLQMLRALVSMLSRLMQKQQQQQQHREQHAINACELLELTLGLLDFTMLCHCNLLLACDTTVPAGRQPPRQQLEQRCLAVSLAAWQTTEAVPAIAALMDALRPSRQTPLSGAVNMFKSLGRWASCGRLLAWSSLPQHFWLPAPCSVAVL